MKRLTWVLAVAVSLSCTGKYVRPTVAEPVKSSPESVERGRYLVDSVAACGACHTGRESDETTLAAFALTPETNQKYLTGYGPVRLPAMSATIFLPNLTSHETGLGGWTDDQIVRAIRDGVDRDGRLMFPMMPFNSYQHMSDEDVQAIVAYLRTVEKKPGPPRMVSQADGIGGFMLARGVAHHPPVTSVKAPDRSDKVKYGQYVAHLAGCADCHSSNDNRSPREPDHELYMAGGPKDEMPGIGTVFFSNLTPDKETGLGKYTADELKLAMRTGRRLDGRRMAPPMSIYMSHWMTMTEEDLDALVAWLQSLKPVKNPVPPRALLPEVEKQFAAAEQ